MSDNIITTFKEILSKSADEQMTKYRVSGLDNEDAQKHIERVQIDNSVFTDYSAFSFIMEKSYTKSPARSADGSIPDLDTYAWFLTPHLKIDFTLLSIDGYRELMKLIRSKNEFSVTCYDVVEDKDVTHNMYFATEQMPKLHTITRMYRIIEEGGGEVDTAITALLGVRDYTVELIGTNTAKNEITVTFHLNKPKNTITEGRVGTEIKKSTQYITMPVACNFYSADIETENKIPLPNFMPVNSSGSPKYKFKYFCDTADGSGFKYKWNGEYMFTEDTDLYAIWEVEASE